MLTLLIDSAYELMCSLGPIAIPPLLEKNSLSIYVDKLRLQIIKIKITEHIFYTKYAALQSAFSHLSIFEMFFQGTYEIHLNDILAACQTQYQTFLKGIVTESDMQQILSNILKIPKLINISGDFPHEL